MTNKLALLVVGAVVVICLGAAAALLVLLFQVQGGPLSFLRPQSLHTEALANACPPPGAVAPGTFQADPQQNVGQWTVETYTAACDVPGQPRTAVRGFYALDHQGTSCGSNGDAPAPSASGGPLAIAVVTAGSCGGRGAPGSLSVTSGTLSAPGAVTARADFSGGVSASAAVHGDYFFIVAPGDRTLCAVRALDATGAVLAETRVASTAGPAGCP